jgi:hypothetical protein
MIEASARRRYPATTTLLLANGHRMMGKNW